MPIVKSICILNVRHIIKFGFKAVVAACVGAVVATAACCETSASQSVAAPSAVEFNPQLTPEMLSPKPSGPLQVMQQPKPVAKPTNGPKSKIVQPAFPRSKHTSRTSIARQHVTKKHFPKPPQVAWGRALDIRLHSTDGLVPTAYGAAAALPQICAPPFPTFMSLQELRACGLLPLGNLPPRSSETAIY
jgi:hypothetical protein